MTFNKIAQLNCFVFLNRYNLLIYFLKQHYAEAANLSEYLVNFTSTKESTKSIKCHKKNITVNT